MKLYLQERLTRDAAAVKLCKDFGWTYDNYLAQPQWFISLALEMQSIDAQRQARSTT